MALWMSLYDRRRLPVSMMHCDLQVTHISGMLGADVLDGIWTREMEEEIRLGSKSLFRRLTCYQRLNAANSRKKQKFTTAPMSSASPDCVAGPAAETLGGKRAVALMAVFLLHIEETLPGATGALLKSLRKALWRPLTPGGSRGSRSHTVSPFILTHSVMASSICTMFTSTGTHWCDRLSIARNIVMIFH